MDQSINEYLKDWVHDLTNLSKCKSYTYEPEHKVTQCNKNNQWTTWPKKWGSRKSLWWLYW